MARTKAARPKSAGKRAPANKPKQAATRAGTPTATRKPATPKAVTRAAAPAATPKPATRKPGTPKTVARAATPTATPKPATPKPAAPKAVAATPTATPKPATPKAATPKAKPTATPKPATPKAGTPKAKPTAGTPTATASAARARPTATPNRKSAAPRKTAKAPTTKRVARTAGRRGARPQPADTAAVESLIVVESSGAVPSLISGDSTEGRRMLMARERMTRSLPVLEILEDEHPVGALRRFLDSIEGEASPQQAQIALGSAQLMLLPSAREHERGTAEIEEIVDLVLHHWPEFGERRRGFHAQEFLRNALAAIGVDRERILQLEDHIPPHPTSELLFSLACAHAVARDKVAMLRAVERALEAGASPQDFRREQSFAPYAKDPELAILLTRAEVPPIPVDIEPYLPGVRLALDSLRSTLKEFGESVELRPGVRLDAILDAERAGKISLPNDYRALLTLTNGLRLWEHEFFGAGDYRGHTTLSTRAQHYLESSFGVTGLAECVPVASWGLPGDWLLYDPRGRLRGGEAGYVLRAGAIEEPVEDLAAVLERMEHLAREVLATN